MYNEITDFLQRGAVLRKPSGEWYLWFSDNDKNHVKSVSYMDFFGSSLSHLQGLGEAKVWSKGDLQAALSKFNSDQPGFGHEDFTALSKENFEIAFQEILSRIHRGEIEKAVPVLFSISKKQCSSSERAHMLQSLLQAPANLYVYGFWDEQGGILGASPEILFTQKDTLVRTMALAGTRPKADSERLPLLKDPKELREHQMVIQDIHQRLSKFGNIRTHVTEELELPVLYHLRTFIDLETTRIGADELMLHMHPTAALGVAPRNYGIQWMKQLPEQERRSIFGAPILFHLPDGEKLCVVSIRNLMWDKNSCYLGVGCGLVEQSQLQREWDELAIKRDMTLRLLGLKT